MWNRKDIKQQARAAFKDNYWVTVVSAIVLGIALAGLTAFSGLTAGTSMEAMSDTSMQIATGIGGSALLATLINYFVMKPLEVGSRKFFMDNSEGRGDINDLLHGFKANYMNNVLAMFLKDLFIVLWSLLFVIPGIVKMYAYRMVPYILAENPDMEGMEALRISEEMMNGHKWDAFVLDLSFIGWGILSVLTFGLLGVFYVNPYVYATDAELYKAIKGEYNGPAVETAYKTDGVGQMA